MREWIDLGKIMGFFSSFKGLFEVSVYVDCIWWVGWFRGSF